MLNTAKNQHKSHNKTHNIEARNFDVDMMLARPIYRSELALLQRRRDAEDNQRNRRDYIRVPYFPWPYPVKSYRRRVAGIHTAVRPTGLAFTLPRTLQKRIATPR